MGALVVLFAGVMAAGCARTTPSAEDLQGRAVDPIAGPGVAALVFVSTRCPISNRYAPTLRALASRFEPSGVTFYGVYPNPDDEPASIETHRREYALSFTALRDPQHALVAATGVRVTPEVAVYRDGERVYVGRIDDRAVELGTFRPDAAEHTFADALETTLAGGTVAPSTTTAVGCSIADVH